MTRQPTSLGYRKRKPQSRTGDSDVGMFEDAVVLKTFGDMSVDLTMLF